MSASIAALPALSLLPALLSLALLALFPASTSAQAPGCYEPVAYPGSAILADGCLYLYGGVTYFDPSPTGKNKGSSQLLCLNLTKSFSTLAPPWTSFPGDRNITMVDAVPSRDGTQLILGGNRDKSGTIGLIYDVATQAWSPAPFYPNMGTMIGYKRTNVGMSLDRSTGHVYIYGGLQEASFSRELAVLDTSGPLKSMKWLANFNQSIIPVLYEPYLAYLPTVKKTLVFAGCSGFNPANGRAGRCDSMANGYLISDGVHDDNGIVAQTLKLQNGGPYARYLGCKVELPDGRVFIQGGRDVGNVFYDDAWILNPGNWTWQKVEIKGNLTQMRRAGHACELGPNGQIIIIGGKLKVLLSMQHQTLIPDGVRQALRRM